MKRYRICLGMLAAFLTWLPAGMTLKADSTQQTIYNSPYVTFSPDGQAWTTNAGDKNVQWYRQGETVYTGATSSLPALNTGEHYYDRAAGMITVGRWETDWRHGQCIHNSYPTEGQDYHGVSFGRSTCGKKHFSGWVAYCADCGEKISDTYVYMSREAAQTIHFIPTGMDYYSLCPFCDNLEQGRTVWHTCKAVSPNMYRVVYDGNFPADSRTQSGYMGNSFHIYGNAGEYEGCPVTPVSKLTPNTYSCVGYRFVGWNTSPDGSGETYGDKAEILNLTAENWNGQPGRNAEGTVILYAQWRSAESTLQIDPDEGVYGGNSGITGVTKPYGDVYIPDASLVELPRGCLVSFEVNGGAAIEAMTAVKSFREWAMVQPFQGTFLDGVYLFNAEEGNTDTLRAVYEPGSILLPQAEREGYSFGGWYYDSEFRLPAGGAGDSIVPAGDLTLYAQWVELVLSAADNYNAYGGSGAVDLSWRLPDGKSKTYLLYQSRNGENWSKVSAADDISRETGVHLELGRKGSDEIYTVPYTGIYTIELAGAQGGGYGSYAGGAGGSVKLRLWLIKGEVLTFTVGGADGYNGGGSGSRYGGGGGCTVLSSDKKGVIAVAGGGGGASEAGNGGAGGSDASLLGTGYDGAAGMAGGGGGYRGGSAGEYILHTHTEDCYETVSGTVMAGKNFYDTLTPRCNDTSWVNITVSGAAAAAAIYADAEKPFVGLQIGNERVYMETPYSGTVTFADNDWEEADAWGYTADSAVSGAVVYFVHQDGSVTNRTINTDTLPHDVALEEEIWFESGNYKMKRDVITKTYDTPDFRGKIIASPSAGGEYPPGTGHGVPSNYMMSGTYSFQVDEDVKGVYVEVSRRITNTDPGCWMSVGIQNMTYRYEGKVLKCGYEEGQVESAKPAYGGNSYVNPDVVIDYSMTTGDRRGDGCAVLDSALVGFCEELELKEVKAADLAAPRAVSSQWVEVVPVGDARVSVFWREPKDEGTIYYHKAEAYLKGSTSCLCTSNVTKNTLVSGVAGYYYVLDTSPETVADGSSNYTSAQNAEFDLGEGIRYLHLAAVDVAGNVGETTHIRLDVEAVAWEIGTRQLWIEEGENVYAAGDKVYFVRCDGVTPFLLEHSAYMNGPATREGQLVYSTFSSGFVGQDGFAGESTVVTPLSEAPETDSETGAEEIAFFTKGVPSLIRYPYSVTRRYGRGRCLGAGQKFMLGPDAHARRIQVIPRTGAVFLKGGEQKTYYSVLEEDVYNDIVLIGDGEGPVIHGLDVLEDGQVINREEEMIRLHITAEDSLSGVAELYAEVVNQDNHSVKRLDAAEGVIEIEITSEEPLFTGDFTVTIYACDNVGNVTEISRSVTEFALDAWIERILAPHEPVFKGGESGILHVTAYGYADRVEVEFPPELAAAREELKRVVFDYTDEQVYMQEAQVQFMVPLYTPTDREYTVKVRAFKHNRELERDPSLVIRLEGGDVLNEFRTRLR